MLGSACFIHGRDPGSRGATPVSLGGEPGLSPGWETRCQQQRADRMCPRWVRGCGVRAGGHVCEAFGPSPVCTRCGSQCCQELCQPHFKGEETEPRPGEITHSGRPSLPGWAGFQLRVPEPQRMARPRPSCLCFSRFLSSSVCTPGTSQCGVRDSASCPYVIPGPRERRRCGIQHRQACTR